MYDLLIKEGFLIDGTGKKGRVGDVAVAGQKIVKITDSIDGDAKVVIEAKGKIVSPGFIDVHTHDDLVFDIDPMNMPKLRQGVTTVITGNCGFGAAPAAKHCRRDLADYNVPILGAQAQKFLFETFGEYMVYMETVKKAINVACLVPHGAVYLSANGFTDRAPGKEELEREWAYVKEAMEAGALGLSLGLMYAPGCYSKEEELMLLAKEVGARGGIVTIHMRSESDGFSESVQAAARLSLQCQTPVEISHLKHVGTGYRGDMRQKLAWLKGLMDQGADLSFDMYPYTMGSTTMAILFPTEYLRSGVKKLLEGLSDEKFREAVTKRLRESWGEEDNLSLLCGWENVILSSAATRKNRGLMGLSVKEIADRRQMGEEAVFMDLFLEEQGEASILLNHIAQEDMEETILFPGVSVASDGLPGAGSPHPRLYGTFPKFLREFVREKGLLTWEEAIHKITWQPAKRFGLEARGRLKEQYFGDLTIFDPETISDKADFSDPRRFPEGIQCVIVNGCVAWQEGGIPKAGQGKLIRRRQSNL